MALTESQKRVAEYEWGYAGTRPIPGTPALQPTPTVPVPRPHTRIYTEVTSKKPAVTQVTKLPTPTVAAVEKYFETKEIPTRKLPTPSVASVERYYRYAEVPTTAAELVRAPRGPQPWQEIRGKEKIQAAVQMGASLAEQEKGLGGATPTFTHLYKRTTPEGIEYQVKPRELVAYEKEVEFLRGVRKADTRAYQAAGVWGSAMAEGITGVTGEFGRQIVSLGAVRLGVMTKEERAEKILTGAAGRRARWRSDPIGVSGRAFISEVATFGISRGLGEVVVGVGAAYPTVGKYAVKGLKLAGTGIVGKELYEPIVSRDPFAIGGKAGQLVGAGVLSYYGFKGGVEYGLREQYLRELPAVKSGQVSLKEVRAELKLAERAGKLGAGDIRPFKEVLGEMEIMQRKGGKVGRVTQEILTEWKGRKIIGGSASARAQIGTKRPADVDIYADMHKSLRSFAKTKYLKAGISVTQKKGGLYLGGEKLMDIHPLEMLTSKQYFTGTRFTPEGIEVMKYETQFFRKTLGKYEEPLKVGRAAKDIPDFEKMAIDVIKRGRIRAKESVPIVKQYRAAKVESFAQAFKKIGTKGYATYTKAPKMEFGIVSLPIGYGYPRPIKTEPFRTDFVYPKPKKAPRTPTYTMGIKPFKAYTVPRVMGYPEVGDVVKMGVPISYPAPTPKDVGIGIPYRVGKTPTTPPIFVRTPPKFEFPSWPKRRPARRRKVRRRKPRYKYTPTLVGVRQARYGGPMLPRAPKAVGIQAVGIRPPVGRKRKKGKKRTAKQRKRRYERNFARSLGL